MIAVLAAVIGYLAGMAEPTRFEATARLLLKDTAAAPVAVDGGGADPVRHLQNQRQLLLSQRVLAVAADRLGSADVTAEGLRRRITAEAADNADVLQLSVVAADARQAADEADAVVEAYQQVVRAQRQDDLEMALTLLDRQRDALRARMADAGAILAADATSPAALAALEAVSQQIADVDERAAQLVVRAATVGSGVEAVEPADVPTRPVSPDPLPTAAQMGLLAAVVASVHAWWWAGRRPLVEDRTQPAGVLHAPLLGELPRFPRRRREASADPRRLFDEVPDIAEAHHMAALAILARTRPRAVIAITGARRHQGCTTVAIGVAAAVAEGRSALLVDADGDIPDATTRLLPSSGARGGVSGRWRIRLPGGRALAFLPATAHAGSPDVAELRRGADLVVIDSGPLLSAASASAAATVVDGVVLVVRQGSAVEDAVAARRRLAVLGAPLLGYVFVAAPLRHPRPRRWWRHR